MNTSYLLGGGTNQLIVRGTRVSVASTPDDNNVMKHSAFERNDKISFYATGTHVHLVSIMFLSLLKLLCQIVAAVNVVQASHSSPEPKDRTSLKSQFIRSRGLNTTLLAGSNGTVTDFTSTSNGSRVPTDLIQHVTLGLPKDPLVQDCANNEGTSVVFQDCSCSTKQVAAQAIDDAITMVHAVQGVWSHPANSPILEYFMGGDAYQSQSCKYPYAVHWIDSESLKHKVRGKP